MLFGLFCMCISMIGMLRLVVVVSVFFWCSVWMLLIMLVFVVIVVCIMFGLKVLMLMGMGVWCVSVLMIGIIWCSFLFSGIGVLLGWVDLLLIFSRFVFLVISCRLCVIVVFIVLCVLLLEKEFGVMLMMFIMCGWFSCSMWLV